MFGNWLYPVLLSIGLIVVFAAMELLSIAISDRWAGRTTVDPGLKREGRQKAA